MKCNCGIWDRLPPDDTDEDMMDAWEYNTLYPAMTGFIFRVP